MKGRIFVRADGNSEIGLGHVIRCIAFANMLKEEFRIVFVIKSPSDNLIGIIKKDIPDIITISEETDFIKYLQKDDTVILDGYQFSSSYQKEIKTKANALVAIDDKAEIHFYADLVINHGTDELLYKKEGYTKVLGGWKYLLVRTPFLVAAKNSRHIANTETVFICMGGADPYNNTTKVLKAVLACSFVNSIVIVIGVAFKFRHELDEAILNNGSQKKISICQNLNAADMVNKISSCSLAIATASSTAMEICCVKAGLLIGTVIDNQSEVNKQLVQNNCAISVGNYNTISDIDLETHIGFLNNRSIINNMMAQQGKYFDGLSAQRLLSEIKEIAC